MPPGEPGFSQLAPVLVRKYTFQIKIIKNATPGAWIFLVLVRKYTFSNKKIKNSTRGALLSPWHFTA